MSRPSFWNREVLWLLPRRLFAGLDFQLYGVDSRGNLILWFVVHLAGGSSFWREPNRHKLPVSFSSGNWCWSLAILSLTSSSYKAFHPTSKCINNTPFFHHISCIIFSTSTHVYNLNYKRNSEYDFCLWHRCNFIYKSVFSSLQPWQCVEV